MGYGVPADDFAGRFVVGMQRTFIPCGDDATRRTGLLAARSPDPCRQTFRSRSQSPFPRKLTFPCNENLPA